MTGVSLREGVGWLRAHLLGDRRMVRDTPVRVYVSGVGRRWVDLPDWPPPGAREHRLYLHAHGRVDPEPPTGADLPTRYRYDPADPTPALGGAVLLERDPVRDNRGLEARPDVVTFTSAPLPADLEAIGPVRAEIALRSTLEHTDVFVRVCDVLPSGPSLNVCDALVRLIPGAPEARPDGSRTAAFDLWPTAYRFRRGHRIRVQVSSGAHPRYARNPGTGEDPVSATTLRAADQEILHDAGHPSSVTLSVIGP
jgi:putative CocE/NonD family hydrolase